MTISKKLNSVMKAGKIRIALLMAALLLTATALTASGREWLKTPFRAARAAMTKGASARATVTTQAAEPQIIRLGPEGFSPTEVSGQDGSYRMAVTRADGATQLVLRLERQDGELVREIEVPQGKPDWTTLIELESGSYVLKVANHWEWVCYITVQ
jgi:hypothetical protein